MQENKSVDKKQVNNKFSNILILPLQLVRSFPIPSLLIARYCRFDTHYFFIRMKCGFLYFKFFLLKYRSSSTCFSPVKLCCILFSAGCYPIIMYPYGLLEKNLGPRLFTYSMSHWAQSTFALYVVHIGCFLFLQVTEFPCINVQYLEVDPWFVMDIE